jgi:hypothetical protein
MKRNARKIGKLNARPRHYAKQLRAMAADTRNRRRARCLRLAAATLFMTLAACCAGAWWLL